MKQLSLSCVTELNFYTCLLVGSIMKLMQAIDCFCLVIKQAEINSRFN